MEIFIAFAAIVAFAVFDAVVERRDRKAMREFFDTPVIRESDPSP